MEHYRCVKIYVPETGKVRDADTVQFFPHSIQFPSTTTEDYLLQASNDILSILKNPPSSLPFLEAGSTTKNAIEKIAKLLNRNTTRQTKKFPAMMHQNRGCNQKLRKIMVQHLRG